MNFMHFLKKFRSPRDFNFLTFQMWSVILFKKKEEEETKREFTEVCKTGMENINEVSLTALADHYI